VLATSASFSYAQSSGNYAAFSLAREENWAPLITEDMNGDGLLDLVYANYDPSLGRQLLIHYQNASGDFPDAPQVIEIKSEIIAIGFGDLREEPGTELILHAANGVFSLSPAIEGYAGNLSPSCASIPSPPFPHAGKWSFCHRLKIVLVIQSSTSSYRQSKASPFSQVHKTGSSSPPAASRQ
jgi:hypothetical protein